MSSVPCQSAYHSERCPPLSESESDEDVARDSNNIENFNSIPSKTGSQTSSKDSRGNPSKLKAESAACHFVDREAFDHTRVDSIANLELNTLILQQHIQDISLEKESIQEQIRKKKRQLFDDIMRVVEYEKSIQAVDAAVEDKLHHFQSRIIELESKRMEIYMSSSEVAVRDVIESEIEEVKENFQQQSEADEADHDVITQQAQTFAASLGDVIREYQVYFEELSAQDKETMKKDFENNMKELKHLVDRPSKFCKDKAGDRFYINVNKERVYQVEKYSSEYKLNVDGQREKIKDGNKLQSEEGDNEFYVDSAGRKIYTKYFFEDEFGRYFVDIHAERNYKTDSEASGYNLVNGEWVKIRDGTYEKDERGRRIVKEVEEEESETGDEAEVGADGTAIKTKTTRTQKAKAKRDDDLNYIKETVGPAIRKALAATALYQPADPVEYFANFLLHYQFTEKMFEQRDKELKYFLEMRKTMKESEE